MAAVVREHHRERGGAALDRLELQDGRDVRERVSASARRGRGLRAAALGGYRSHAAKRDHGGGEQRRAPAASTRG